VLKTTIVVAILCLPALALGHFQELIPNTDIVTPASGRQISLDLTFTHPMLRGPIMSMERPVAFGVINPNGKQSLLHTLQVSPNGGPTKYQAYYEIQQPGDHIFYLHPAPYWESHEGKMITHYTKVIVDAYDGTQLWRQAVGFPLEIQPLVRPYGLWSGNQFRGEVTKGGKPVPYATIEVEWRNDGSITPPSAPYSTQVIIADANGTFSYTMPRSGWWGFTALLEEDLMVASPQGEQVTSEIGAVIWVQTRDMQ